MEALELARRERPDLVILDVMLPKLDGFEVCRALRRDTTVPILMLTAKDDEVDKVVGLELGADEYMTKPFSMRELMARVKAMLRRVQMLRDEAAARTEEALAVLKAGDLKVDSPQHRVHLGRVELSLKAKEFELLAFLVRGKGQVFTRELLLQRVWSYDFVGDTRRKVRFPPDSRCPYPGSARSVGSSLPTEDRGRALDANADGGEPPSEDRDSSGCWLPVRRLSQRATMGQHPSTRRLS